MLKPVGGTLFWSKRFEHPPRFHGNLKITHLEVPLEYRGVLKEVAKRNIENAIYSKVKGKITYMVKEVDFTNQMAEVIRYEF